MADLSINVCFDLSKRISVCERDFEGYQIKPKFPGDNMTIESRLLLKLNASVMLVWPTHTTKFYIKQGFAVSFFYGNV
jgi:hypothetical protein